MPLTRVKQKYQITIPEKLRKEARLEVGDFLDAYISKNSIILRPKVMVDKSVDEDINEGLKDLKAEKTTPSFSSVKEFKQFLKKK